MNWWCSYVGLFSFLLFRLTQNSSAPFCRFWQKVLAKSSGKKFWQKVLAIMSERPAATVLYLRWSFDNLISNSIFNTILSENNIYIILSQRKIFSDMVWCYSGLKILLIPNLFPYLERYEICNDVMLASVWQS